MPLQLLKDLLSEEKSSRVCVFCARSDDNELLYGKFYANEDIAAHYYCLLFSSGLEQKGKDEEGILGFLKQDILKECRRGTRLACSKCKHIGATVGCCNKQCKKTYHFPCGAESRMLNQFFGAFHSYCVKHQPVQNVVVKSPGAKATCTICHDDIPASPSFDVLWAPCCKKQSWFHRICMQKLALSAGYFFKCPICSNTTLFCSEMKQCGIYIPEQDASWELEPNAFQELVQRHNKCDHPTCICPKGRTHDGEGTRWELLLCASCGSKGVHIGCGKLDWTTMEWDCEDCSALTARLNNPPPKEPGPSTTSDDITVIDNTLASRVALKRHHSDESQPHSSSSDDSSNSEDSDVEILAVSDSDGQSDLRTSYPSNAETKPTQPSRNVARRGRGSWASRRPSTQESSRSSTCMLNSLRFKISDDAQKIIVYVENEKAPVKSYTIPVDRPVTRARKKRN